MFLNLIKFFGPGVVPFVRVLMEADGAGAGGAAPAAGSEGGAGGAAPSGNEDGQAAAVEAAQTRTQLIELYKSREDVVPDMIGGASLAEINQSLQQAQAAFVAIRDKVLSPYQAAIEASQANGSAQALGFQNIGAQRVVPAAPAAPVNPGGAGAGKQAPGAGPDVSKLSPMAKIALGLSMKGQSR